MKPLHHGPIRSRALTTSSNHEGIGADRAEQKRILAGMSDAEIAQFVGMFGDAQGIPRENVARALGSCTTEGHPGPRQLASTLRKVARLHGGSNVA